MKFITKYEEKKPNPSSFDIPKEKIFIKLGSEQKVNAYDRIQAANVDLDIYETLEKYNMAPTLANVTEIIPQTEQVYQDFRAIQDFEHPQDYVDHANSLWNRLPLEIRAEFGNDKKLFAKEGKEWFNKNQNKIAKQIEMKKQKQIQTEPVKTKATKTGEEK